MALSIAVQVYSVRDDAKEDLRGTLEKIKKMGYDGVEFAGLYGNSPAEIKAMCAEIGLTPISAHVPYLDMLADPKGVLSQYAEIGVKFVAVPYLTPEYRPGTDAFPEVVKNVEMLGKVAKELGIQLLYHNHDFEFAKIDGKYALDMLYDTVPADYLKTELDVCWVNVGGEVPADYIRKYSGRAPVVHLKDFYGEKDENMYELIGINTPAPKKPGNFEFRPVGSGLNDFPAILAAATEAGAEWVVVEQDKPSMGLTPLQCIEKSINYLKSIGC
ncbi:MAG: sugar phosphate isomerase/epimerase [Ruminococcaceae bacterium]|nr:sugar phosphate isomerase/epimerase [Oscillospiraceae bacterium]